MLELAEFFLQQIEPRSLPLPDATKQLLRTRSWPGNVRELRHALEHAAILSRGGSLLPEHFPVVSSAGSDLTDQFRSLIQRWVAEQVAAAEPGEPAGLYDAFLKSVEPHLLKEVLDRLQGNRLAASRWLGLARATVRKLIAQHISSEAADGDDDGETPPKIVG